MIDLDYMHLALKEAMQAEAEDEVPVGAVLVRQGQVISRAHNLCVQKKDASAHAELLALQKGMECLGDWRLTDCCLYVTLEPCAMCAGAMVNARLERLVYGAFDPRWGCCGSIFDLVTDALGHTVQCVGGVGEPECAAILSEYFRKKRGEKEGPVF